VVSVTASDGRDERQACWTEFVGDDDPNTTTCPKCGQPALTARPDRTTTELTLRDGEDRTELTAYLCDGCFWRLYERLFLGFGLDDGPDWWGEGE
jgi:hypothetical protein